MLSSFDLDRVPQAVSDVVHRHRGNAFVLDQQAVYASREQRTLILLCYLQSDAGFDAPRLVRFDELTFPESHLPYLEDRLVGILNEQISQRRRPYFHALQAWGDRIGDLQVPELEQFDDRWSIDYLVAAGFSIVAAAAGKPKNYASSHPNIKGMLNSYLAPGRLDPYARLLLELIKNSAQRSLLTGSVGEHLQRSMNGSIFERVEQVDEKSLEWTLLRDLFPEALDPFKRQQLMDANALPPWADPGDS